MWCKPGKMLRRMRGWVAAALCGAGLPGCLNAFHPVQAPSPECRNFCREVPGECRGNVYIFLLNGADPLQYGNLAGVRDYLHDIGFGKTYYGQLYHASYFADEMRKIHQERPEARFVIVGFDYGADAARQLAEIAGAEQVPIDLLLYLEPRGLSGVACCPGVPVRRVVSLCTPPGWLGDSKDLTGAENMQVACTSRYRIPTHPVTIDLLTQELTTAAMTVPVSGRPDESLPPLVEPPPTPRPVTAEKATRPDDWDFLKPVSRQKVTESISESRSGEISGPKFAER